MGILHDAKQAWRDAGQQSLKNNTRRDLTEDDRGAWFDAQDEREASIKPRKISDVQALLRNRNPVRWHQTQSNFRWVQKEMKKMGLNPEDARYIL